MSILFTIEFLHHYLPRIEKPIDIKTEHVCVLIHLLNLGSKDGSLLVLLLCCLDHVKEEINLSAIALSRFAFDRWTRCLLQDVELVISDECFQERGRYS